MVIILFLLPKTQKQCSCSSFNSTRQSKLSKHLSKEFDRSVYWNEYKTKSETKTATIEFRYFLESNFVAVNRLFLLVYLYKDNDVKQFKTPK